MLQKLLPNPERYAAILKPHVDVIIRRYPSSLLQRHFESLGQRLIAVCPMALCDLTLTELGFAPDDDYLASLGLHMLAIATHDDIVDQLLDNRSVVAQLLYAGDIASNEGSRLLFRRARPDVADTLLAQINRNHFYQHHVVETLWQREAADFAEYRSGIYHASVMANIGVLYALSIASRLDLKPPLEIFADHYGLALQLVDDILEVDDDSRYGYHSFPVKEGWPYTLSFRHLFVALDECRGALEHSWVGLQELVARLHGFAVSLRTELEAAPKP